MITRLMSFPLLTGHMTGCGDTDLHNLPTSVSA